MTHDHSQPLDVTRALQRAMEHQQAGRLGEAETLCRAVLAQQPDDAETLHLLGVIVARAARFDEGIDLLRRAIAINPAEARYHGNLGSILRAAGRLEEAVAACRQALLLRPQSPKMHEELAMALGGLGRDAEAFFHFGSSLANKDELDEADDVFRRAMALDPQYAEPHIGAANVRWQAGRADEAVQSFRAALRLRPQQVATHSCLLFSMQFSPRETAESILAEHRRFDEIHARPLQSTIRPHENDRRENRRLRIGCVSGDFRNHVQSLYTLPLFAAHDREQIELFCYSNVPQPDPVTQRIAELADNWRDTARLSDDQVAEMIRADAIDILVDHNMHMTFARPLIFARKPAPVQVAWLAYPGTTGLSAMDYRLTDPHLDPPGEGTTQKYTETSIHLPETFWCYDPMFDDPVADPPAIRNGHITFGCMGNFAKVNDGVLALWLRVLAGVPKSGFLLQAPSGATRQRVLDRFAVGGVDASRIEFVGFMQRSEYLDRYRGIDILLDTGPYNGHTTSMDALWMGVPVVTMLGRTVVGRAGWSQSNNVGLTDLVARDEAQFVRIASELAGDVPRLAELRRTLRERMRASPLIDAKRFAGNMETAFRTMWRRWCAADGKP